MSTNSDHSVTRWISALKDGERSEALRQLMGRYFSRLARLSEAQLRARARGPADGEDIALSAFESLFRGARLGRFPQLDDRDDFWRLLTTIAVRKASNQRRHEGRAKRGGGRVVVGSDLAADGDADADVDPLAQVAASEPTPELAAALVDDLRQRFIDLPDDSLRVVALLRMEGFANEEIARALDCSPRSVERKLEQIRRVWTRGVPESRRLDPSHPADDQ
jgi:DNA-directed RNA polymerase specialized sigma24 family protein